MPKNHKQAAIIPKQPSAGARPKATRSSKTHTSLNSAKDSKMNGAKDVETGVRDEDVGALVASLRAEINRLKNQQTPTPIEEGIPRPTKITSLQDAMGLLENKKLYTHCRSVVRDVMARAGVPVEVDWRSQDAVVIGKIAKVANSRSKQLQRYKGNWATLEIIKTLIKNRRSYKKRLGPIDNDDDREFNTSKDEDGNGSDDGDIEDMYADDVDPNGIGGEDEDENGGGEDEDENGGGEDEDENGGGEDEDEDGGKVITCGAGENGLEELGGDDDEGRDGNVKQAGRKRKVNRDDDELVTATRGKLRKTMGSSGEKALPKGRNFKK